MPRIDDPTEFALIRETYFEPAFVSHEKTDPEEAWDRESRKKTKNYSR